MGDLGTTSGERLTEPQIPLGTRMIGRNMANRAATLCLSLLLLSTVAVIFLIAQGYATTRPIQDMVQFWAAARLIDQNPYSVQLVPALEKSVGARIASANDPLFVTRNPPWALPFYLPLRLMGYGAAYATWTVFSFVVIVVCSRVIWKLYTPRASLIPLFLCLIFGPTMVLPELGQSSVLVLAGITLFLWSVHRQQYWLAGYSLLLVSIKPHISFLFLLAVLLWATYFRRWGVILGGVLAVFVNSWLVLAINPKIFSQYLNHITVVANEAYQFPNLGGMLYGVSRWRPAAIVPEIAGTVWLAVYWWLHRADWDWKKHGMVVLAVSLVCSYYSFAYDEIIALPVLLAAAANGNRRILFTGLILTNCAYAVYLSKLSEILGLHYMFLWWTGSAWMVTYLLSQPSSQTSLRLQKLVAELHPNPGAARLT